VGPGAYNLQNILLRCNNEKLGVLLQVLLPIQQAKMAVQAYPWPTDTLAICCLILEEIGEMQSEKGQASFPNTQDLLQRVTGHSPFLSLAGARANTHVPTA
jgi:hypothetical protein